MIKKSPKFAVTFLLAGCGYRKRGAAATIVI
jgi:hypothetical protein